MATKTRILIADDHQLVIQGIVCSLKEIGDFDIVTTNNCDDAFQLIKAHQNENPFHLLFTDLSFDNATEETNLDGGEDTDEFALENSYVSVVPIQFDLTAHHFIKKLNTWNLND